MRWANSSCRRFHAQVVVLRVMDGAQKQQAMRIYYVRN